MERVNFDASCEYERVKTLECRLLSKFVNFENATDNENARCKVLRASGQRRDLSPFMQQAHNTFNVQRHLVSASTHRTFRASVMQTWREVVA